VLYLTCTARSEMYTQHLCCPTLTQCIFYQNLVFCNGKFFKRVAATGNELGWFEQESVPGRSEGHQVKETGKQIKLLYSV
jgi:hypothetical protein